VEDTRTLDASATGGVSLELRFTNISALHRRFFSDPELMVDLAERLAPCISGVAPVVVTYDGEARRGHIVLDVPRSSLTCSAVHDGAVDVSALTPLSEAVASYRNAVAGLKDIRVFSFDAGVFVRDGIGWASLFAYGQEPSDGTSLHPCVGLDGLERCTKAEPDQGVLRYALEEGWVTRRLATVLTPGAPLGVATEGLEPEAAVESEPRTESESQGQPEGAASVP
jgi:hypothetical protein